MPGPMHKLHRAVAEITLGVVQSTRERDALDLDMALTESEQQYRVPIEGEASPGWGFGEVDIEFDSHFFYAPAQRDSDLEFPHFTFGAICEQDAVIVARVKTWDVREHNGAIKGATVGVAVICAEAYEAEVDLRFQGYAALDETESEDLET